MIYVFLADGFETIEALACVDIMRRAKLEVETVGVTGKVCTSAQNLPVVADILISETVLDDLDGIILPGGVSGVNKLDENTTFHSILNFAYENKLMIGAICAAPSILAKKGMLDDIEATAFPDFEDMIDIYSHKYIVTSGNIITARGAGVSIEFGFEIVKYLCSEQTADSIRSVIQWNK